MEKENRSNKEIIGTQDNKIDTRTCPTAMGEPGRGRWKRSHAQRPHCVETGCIELHTRPSKNQENHTCLHFCVGTINTENYSKYSLTQLSNDVFCSRKIMTEMYAIEPTPFQMIHKYSYTHKTLVNGHPQVSLQFTQEHNYPLVVAVLITRDCKTETFIYFDSNM